MRDRKNRVKAIRGMKSVNDSGMDSNSRNGYPETTNNQQV
jgi:hypothetical protein